MCKIYMVFINILPVVDCGSLDDPTNGAVDTFSGTTFMMTATYTCNTGYNIVGDMTRTCQDAMLWSGAAPTCDSEIIIK